jgi:mevalonate kinase
VSVRHASLEPASARACGKVILLGEHVVVHGRPAIAAGIDRFVELNVSPRADGRRVVISEDPRVETALDEAAAIVSIPPDVGFTVAIGGDLPISVGLGSSAAFAVALVRALGRACGQQLSLDELSEAANRIDRIFHGRPSGIDAAAAAHGGVLWFESGPPRIRRPVRTSGTLTLVVILTGTRHATGQMVGELAARRTSDPEVYDPVFDAIGRLTTSARGALERGDRPFLGRLMSMNHDLLRACGVSTPALDRVVERALVLGALGAKLTGGGGGGAVVALPAGNPTELVRALGEEGLEAFAAAVSEPAGGAA